jgi:para-aminobenzoate synthetase/4-amino-4-deoxychorismate lyase
VARPPFWLAFYDHVLIHDANGWWFESLPTVARTEALAARLALWQERLANAAELPPALPRPSRFRLRAGGADSHLAAVAEAKRRIATGELFQANVCLRLEAEFDGDALGLASGAFSSAQPRFGALVGDTLSLSPERFLRRVGRHIRSEPIKGTAPRSGDPQSAEAHRTALTRSGKDAAEHVMIVDLMRNDLGRVCRYGSVHAQAPRIEPHAGVWHIVSTVTGELREGVDDAALLAATFPPGSVTGAPKVQAMKVITELEASRREAYTGAVGMVSPLAGLDLNVAIRTFELAAGRIWIGVGGGIVSDSDPDAELREALVKASGPITAIGGELELPPPGLGAHTHAMRGLAELALDHGTRPDPDEGVFETILARDGRTAWLQAHLQRLAASLRELYGVELPAERWAALDAEVRNVAAASGPRARIRVLAGSDATLTVTATPEPPAAKTPVRLKPFVLPGGLGAHKWRDRRLLAALTATAASAVPLLIEYDGTILEAGHANVWIDSGGELLTPPADGRILPGVTRAALLASRVNAREQRLDLTQLVAADAVFLTSAISGRRQARL